MPDAFTLAKQPRLIAPTKNGEAERQRRDVDMLLRAVVKAGRLLAEAPDLEAGLRGAVVVLGELTGIDRVYVFQYLEGCRFISLVADYARPPIQPLLAVDPAWARLPMADFSEILAAHERGEAWLSVHSERVGRNAEMNEANGAKSDAIVPIFAGSELWGCIGFDYCQELHVHSEPELDVLRSAAAAIAAAVQRECHEREQREALAVERERAAQERVAELVKANEVLRRSVERMVEDSRLESLLGAFLIEGLHATGASAAALMLRVPGTRTNFRLAAVFADEHLLSAEEIAADAHLARLAELSGQDPGDIFSGLARGEMPSIRVEDLRATLPSAFDFHTRRGQRMLWHAPLRLRGKVLGFAAFAMNEEKIPGEAVQETVTALTQQFTLALELTRLADEAKQAAIAREREAAALMRAAELAKANDSLARTSAQLVEQPDLKAFLSQVVIEAMRQLNADAGLLTMLDEIRETLQAVVFAEAGKIVSSETMATEMEVEQAGFFPLIRESRKARFFDLEHESELFWHGSIEYHRRRSHKAVLGVPLFAGNKPLGHLGLAFTRTELISEQQTELVTALAGHASLAIQLTRLADEARHEAEESAVLNERNRIARDLHDTLAQGFTGILAQLGVIEGVLAAEPELDGEIQHALTLAGELARTSLAEARRSVRVLREDGGLTDAGFALQLPASLETLIDRMTSGTRLHASLSVGSALPPLPPTVEEIVRRIAQEALTNALKHAGPDARTFTLALSCGDGRVCLAARDDGRGFDPTALESGNEGFGLTGMRERVASVGGNFFIRSAPGAGAEIVVELPVS